MYSTASIFTGRSSRDSTPATATDSQANFSPASTTTSMVSSAQITTADRSSTEILPIYSSTTDSAAMMAEKAIFLDNAI